MAQLEQVEGIILSVRDYRESDRLVKIFTANVGKRMFFVAGTRKPRSRIAPAILSFTKAVYIADIKKTGLCFLRDAKEIHYYQTIQQNIFLNAYATYILGLADAALEDGVADGKLYHRIERILERMDDGEDPEILVNIFEMQLLPYFGVAPTMMGCSVCGETTGKFDFSMRYQGILCEKHWDKDAYRMHASERAVYLLRLFSAVDIDKIGQISVKKETKQEIRKILDLIYTEMVGIHLKSKSFIDKMENTNFFKEI